MNTTRERVPTSPNEAFTPHHLTALLALDQIPGLGARTCRKLLEATGSPQLLWEQFDEVLQATPASARTQPLIAAWRQTRQRIQPEELLRQCEALSIQPIGLGDALYPPMLAHVYDPPIVLYARGNPGALQGKTIGFVGTRKASAYGRQVTERLIGDLAPCGVTIISGLAMGIDACAHQAALANHLPTVAVFGCGIDQIYPRAHERLASEILASGGALVSEYPPGAPGSRATFPQRNRIIAGLCYGVAVIEGDIASGSMITARAAFEEGRAVFAVPGNVFSPGSQGPIKLLKDGAAMLTCADDLLSELRWLKPDQARQPSLFEATGHVASEGCAASAEKSPQEALSPEEREILALIEFEPTPTERLQQRSGLPAATLSQALTMLELAGHIALLPGAKACRL
ncbi:MAG: DNA-protecting protein DprA [Vampirovibrionales bacterium]|nr:DNA-protecting protein DprA [Vampirovibrionales bacterium]